MFEDWPLLSLLIWLPVIGGAAVLLVRSEDRARWLALGVSVVAFVLSLFLWTGFEAGTASMQFVERVPWISSFDIDYHLGVDGISMPLIVLTTFITVLVVIAGWDVIQYKPAAYYSAFLIMEGIMIGVFAALDAILFYIFFEATLIPMFLIIGIWGGPARVYATIKFFIYTFLGSVMMLVALIYLGYQAGTFTITEIPERTDLALGVQIWIFLAFLVAFAVKVPMWPVHTWLPDAHVEAPTGGSVILAALMLKIGGYGFLRFSLPITPEASAHLDWLLIALSLVAIVYVGLVAMVQEDMKKLIAYSSIAHMGFVTLGYFIIFRIVGAQEEPAAGGMLALTGGAVQMISHGFVSAALFLCVGVLYDRVHSRRIDAYGGVAHRMPVFAGFFVLFAMANAGLPGTSGFVGEFMVVLGSFQAGFWYAAIAALTLILGAAYTLWMIKRVVYGEVANDEVDELDDVNARERLVLGVLAVAVIALGVWPDPLIDVMAPSLEQLFTTATA